MRWWVVVVVVGVSSLAFAQVVPEREVEITQSLYDTGKYAEAARRANEVLSLANFSEPQRIKLHELAGLSAFNLGDVKAAQAAFLQLLRINPDHILDPFAVPPPAIKLFDQVRKDNADALNLVRQQIALRLEREKRDAEERLRALKEQEERRQKEALLSSELVVRTIEKRPIVVNLIPFGVGQFQQGRVGWGAAFAVSEGIAAILSIVSFLAIESLFVEETRSLPGYVVPVTVKFRYIPEDRRTERDVWTGLKFGTGAAFYALWAIGVGDALFHHEDEVVTERREPVTPKTKVPAARLRIYPTPGGGIGAGLTIGF
ncbi:MAG: tetratricopeptide repeat protein [Myxococcota bacterium]